MSLSRERESSSVLGLSFITTLLLCVDEELPKSLFQNVLDFMVLDFCCSGSGEDESSREGGSMSNLGIFLREGVYLSDGERSLHHRFFGELSEEEVLEISTTSFSGDWKRTRFPAFWVLSLSLPITEVLDF